MQVLVLVEVVALADGLDLPIRENTGETFLLPLIVMQVLSFVACQVAEEETRSCARGVLKHIRNA